jgi:ABC-type branched-subunit amino acid transport system substrate-binding protein
MTGANLALPEVGNALSASINALNARGGINGHPLKLDQCDSQGAASTEVQCAQQMVSDHVVATLEDNTFTASAQVNTILQGGGIPRIGVTMDDTTDYANMDNFDFTGGGVFSLVSILDDLVHRGDKTLSVMLPDTPTASQTHLLLDPIATSLGVKIVNYILVSSASGDYSQYVAQASQNGATGTVVALGNSQLVQVGQAINQLNPKMDWATGIAGFSLNQLKQLQPFSKNASYAWWYPGLDDVKNFPGLAQPLADLKAYMKGFSVNTNTPIALAPWMAVHAFDVVMKTQAGTPTSASVLAAFKAATNIPMNGLIKPWSPGVYVSPGSLGAIFKNISNPYSYRIAYNGSGTQTSSSQMFNTFVGLPGYTGS